MYDANIFKLSKRPGGHINTETSKRACRGRQALLEKVFCYLWGVAKNYIMYWGVTSIIIPIKVKKCSQKRKFFNFIFVEYHYLLCKSYNTLYILSYFQAFCCAFLPIDHRIRYYAKSSRNSSPVTFSFSSSNSADLCKIFIFSLRILSASL